MKRTEGRGRCSRGEGRGRCSRGDRRGENLRRSYDMIVCSCCGALVQVPAMCGVMCDEGREEGGEGACSSGGEWYSIQRVVRVHAVVVMRVVQHTEGGEGACSSGDESGEVLVKLLACIVDKFERR